MIFEEFLNWINEMEESGCCTKCRAITFYFFLLFFFCRVFYTVFTFRAIRNGTPCINRVTIIYILSRSHVFTRRIFIVIIETNSISISNVFHCQDV